MTGDERLTVAQVADLLGIKPGTFRAYRTRKVGRKYAPDPDGHYDERTPWWWRSTIKEWRPDRVQ